MYAFFGVFHIIRLGVAGGKEGANCFYVLENRGGADQVVGEIGLEPVTAALEGLCF